MNRRSFITVLAGLPIAGRLFRQEKRPEAGDVVDLRVCRRCEAERLDWLAKQSRNHHCMDSACLSPSFRTGLPQTGDVIFRGAGNVEVLRLCSHRLWVNPAVKTNEAATEFIGCIGGLLGGRGLLTN